MAKRRQAGEGGINEYQTAKGTRYSILYYVPQEHGKPKRAQKRGFITKKDAARELRNINQKIENHTYTPPTKLTVEGYFEQWLDSLRLRPGTIANYRRTVRLHVTPYIGEVRLDQLTGTRLSAMYRDLESKGFRRGEKAGEQGLSARTVRYVHTIVSAALRQAVADGLLVVNPATKAKPPTATEARAPEMTAWTTEQAAAFLAWTRENREGWQAWHVLLYTGMRRGELVGLRWSDVDLDGRTISVGRSVGVHIADGRQVSIGPTKTGKPRVVNIDAGTVEVLREWRKGRAGVGLALAHRDAYVFGTLDGGHMDPDTLSARFVRHLGAARDALGEDVLPVVRVHDIRHTHATALLRAGQPVKVVSERLGHTDVMTTMRVYQHVMPGMQAAAADTFAALLGT
jgi:integrase